MQNCVCPWILRVPRQVRRDLRGRPSLWIERPELFGLVLAVGAIVAVIVKACER